MEIYILVICSMEVLLNFIKKEFMLDKSRNTKNMEKENMKDFVIRDFNIKDNSTIISTMEKEC